jgi:hypothetical protein
MQNLNRAVGIDVQLEYRRALGAERAFAVWASWVALDIDDLIVNGMNKGRAAD